MVHHRWSFKPWELKQRLLGLNQIHSHPEGTQLFSRSALPPDSHRYSNEQLCFSTNSPNSAASSSPPPDSPTILLTNFSSQSCARRSQRSKRSRCTCCTCLPGCPGHHRTGAAPSHATAATSPAGLYKKYVQHAGQGPQLRGDIWRLRAIRDAMRVQNMIFGQLAATPRTVTFIMEWQKYGPAARRARPRRTATSTYCTKRPIADVSRRYRCIFCIFVNCIAALLAKKKVYTGCCTCSLAVQLQYIF